MSPPSHPHAALIQRFYDAFAARDGATMATCYHRDLVFHDPAFGTLDARQAGAMWQMLCARASDLAVTVTDIEADDSRGGARWEARYTFSRTRRPVRNRITATFRFQDGLMVAHTDHFSFWRWSRQALGVSGWALGWTPWLQERVRGTARAGLTAFMARPAADSGAGQ
jgi:ketosteroid isomerase-like protein